MKQTVEKEAISFANKCRIANIKGGLDYPYDELDMRNAFEEGAKWQSKQSPWISVKEKAGCDSSNDCIVMDSDGEVFRACFIRNKWLKYNRGYYVIDNVTHWMPIPSFDEILEANRDVLERIKEKGD